MSIARQDLQADDGFDVVTAGHLGPVSPGEVLLKEFIEPAGLSVPAVARDIGGAADDLAAIVRGEQSIAAKTAILLGRRFDTTPEFWLGLQMAYDLELARAEIDHVG